MSLEEGKLKEGIKQSFNHNLRLKDENNKIKVASMRDVGS
jgi:hypothetical protein